MKGAFQDVQVAEVELDLPYFKGKWLRMQPLHGQDWPEGGGNMPMIRPARKRRYVFVTPYYKETRDCLDRCIASVKRQTIGADHILVADGFPQDWIDQANVRHLRLDRAHEDYGNTPRAMGGLMAVAEGYGGIGFLDADCWLEPDHLEHCLEQTEQVGLERCGFVAASRTLRRLDESVIDVPDEPSATHVDTSCLLLLPPSFGALPVWILMPREVSVVGDRVFYLVLRSQNLISAFSTRQTVNYTYTFAPMYRALGEAPPEPTKENPDHAAIAGWIDTLPPDRLEAVNRHLGADLRALYRLKAESGASGVQSKSRIKARPETMETFWALANSNGWSPGEAFEQAVAALRAKCKV
ncbi:MAG TPA: glycosyltransferase [Acetobacteraceae bacterium]|nr:glycosyltransferase [Acetobacteraceae bacterium]